LCSCINKAIGISIIVIYFLCRRRQMPNMCLDRIKCLACFCLHTLAPVLSGLAYPRIYIWAQSKRRPASKDRAYSRASGSRRNRNYCARLNDLTARSGYVSFISLARRGKSLRTHDESGKAFGLLFPCVLLQIAFFFSYRET
jgi:hypothetical protein